MKQETRPGGVRARRSATSWVLSGSLVGGVGAYLFQVLGVRQLSEEAFAPIGVLWTVQYLVMSVALAAIEAYLTRTVATHGVQGAARRRALPWIGLVAVAVTAFGLVTRDALLGGDAALAAVGGLIVLSYGAFVVLRGRLAGEERFRAYGSATAGESVARLLFALALLAVTPSTRTLALAMPLGPLAVWALFKLRRWPAARPPQAHAASPVTTLGRFLAPTIAAAAIAQTLLASGPLVLPALGGSTAAVAVLFVTVTAARVPLVLAFGGLLSRVLPPLQRELPRLPPERLRRLTVLGGTALTVVTVALAGVAFAVGPALVALVFGPSIRPDATVVALVAAAVLLGTVALFGNQALVALHAERRMLPPWVAALVVAVVVLVVSPSEPSARVALAMFAGQVTALAGLAAALLRAAGDRAAAGGGPLVQAGSASAGPPVSGRSRPSSSR